MFRFVFLCVLLGGTLVVCGKGEAGPVCAQARSRGRPRGAGLE